MADVLDAVSLQQAGDDARGFLEMIAALRFRAGIGEAQVQLIEQAAEFGPLGAVPLDRIPEDGNRFHLRFVCDGLGGLEPLLALHEASARRLKYSSWTVLQGQSSGSPEDCHSRKQNSQTSATPLQPPSVARLPQWQFETSVSECTVASVFMSESSLFPSGVER